MEDKLPAETHIGQVRLAVSNLDRSVKFYEQQLGFKMHQRQNGMAVLGAGGPDLLTLVEEPGEKRVEGTTGLYHLAILTPSRQALARSIRRLAETQTSIQGVADHLVSEAIYLADPDGNGIEIYRDRPRSEWPYVDGNLRMASDPLDLDGILGELADRDEPWTGLDPATVIGHVHLHVRDTAEAERFYCDVLGFDLMTRFGRSASFISAGGYHHHLGVNVWAGVGAPPPPPDAVGLRWFEIALPDSEALHGVAERVQSAGFAYSVREDGVLLRDPSQNGILLTAR